MKKRSSKIKGEDKPEERNRKRKSEGRKEVGKKRKRNLFKKEAKKRSFSQKLNATKRMKT